LSFKHPLVVMILFGAFLFAPLAHAEKKSILVAGWVENIYIKDIDAKLKAKLDTGAKTSSMRADVLKIVKAKKKGGKRRVVFQIEDTNGKISTLERRLVRWVRIKSKKADTYHRRPVVDMEFCIGNRLVHDEVNLSPREDFIYPLLVGRNMIRAARLAVNPSKTFVTKPLCADVSSSAEE
jgi:hypothetical protein